MNPVPTITSITSSTTANGTYTVGAGQTSVDLTASSIELNPGSLSDAGLNLNKLYSRRQI